MDATPDLSHVILFSQQNLTSNAEEGGLFEWAGGNLQLISVLPEGTTRVPSPQLGGKNLNVRHAVSNDGSRLVWSAEAGAGGDLYLRDTTMEETVQVNVAEPSVNDGCSEPCVPYFQLASSDDSRIFFTDDAQLTVDSTARPGITEYTRARDLYVYEVTSGGGQKLTGKLTDLTVDGNAGESAEVQGAVLGSSEDGSSVYFVGKGVLTNVPNEENEKASPGADNLYVRHYNTEGKEWEKPTFIVSLLGEDEPDWGRSFGMADLRPATSRVSPNGSYLAFMSARSLTGYDNRDAASGVPDGEVFLYDASSNHLVCASCNPSGARPQGVEDSHGANGNKGLLVDPNSSVWENLWLAGNIPGWSPVDAGHSLYQSRYLSDSGRLFFNSADALVSQDTNGFEDVYEYEPDGTGSCDRSSTTFSGISDGCLALISSGKSGDESAFLDASASGDDVFFLTTARLASKDVDTAYDIYDAHDCLASPCPPPAPVAPPACITGDSCKAAPSPQPAVFGAPPTATFSGAGNLTQLPATHVVKPKLKSLTRAQKLGNALKTCKKKRRSKRASCEARARARFGSARKAKRSKGRGK